ncbi:hypothetical protein [Synechococcus elongatus]|uniref:hypothetical protein n=1 Tax=Synechococcus elongatus TaxID=32046 RepID=UPI0009D63FE5
MALGLGLKAAGYEVAIATQPTISRWWKGWGWSFGWWRVIPKGCSSNQALTPRKRSRRQRSC